MRGRLNETHRLHQGVLHSDRDVGARVALAHFGELAVVGLGQFAGGAADGELEHLHACGQVWEADVHSPLEAAADSGVELPGDVCGAEDEHAAGVLAYAVHLYEELGFDAARGFGFAFAARAAEGVNFVDEDDGGLVFAGHGEELFD